MKIQKKKKITIKQKQGGTHAYYEIDVVFMSEKCHFSIYTRVKNVIIFWSDGGGETLDKDEIGWACG